MANMVKEQDRNADESLPRAPAFAEAVDPDRCGTVLPGARDCAGVIQRISSGRRSLALQNIHSFGRGECARATLAVALGIIALGTGHRRREPFLQLRLRLLHGSRRWLVTKVSADGLWRAQSRQRIASRIANSCLELRDIAGARSGPCIRRGESEYRREKSRCYPGIGHTEHPAIRVCEETLTSS